MTAEKSPSIPLFSKGDVLIVDASNPLSEF